jgi:predicted amidohydrolase
MSQGVWGVAQAGLLSLSMNVALVQFNAGPDKRDNLRRALRFVQKAAARRARWILLPEVFNYRGDLTHPENFKAVAERIPGESVVPFMQVAAQEKVFILLGSMIEQAPSRTKAYNTSVLINDKGKIDAVYRKMHLFGAQIGKTELRESSVFLAGKKPVMSRINDFRVGMSVCYDLRFPDLYQSYRRKGADVLTVPAAFTALTGQAHWEVLLRARAIENQCYVLAPNQVGRDGRGIATHGHSMVISPWGEVLAKGSPDKEEIVYAQIFLEEIEKSQKILPGFRKIA